MWNQNPVLSTNNVLHKVWIFITSRIEINAVDEALAAKKQCCSVLLSMEIHALKFP